MFKLGEEYCWSLCLCEDGQHCTDALRIMVRVSLHPDATSTAVSAVGKVQSGELHRTLHCVVVLSEERVCRNSFMDSAHICKPRQLQSLCWLHASCDTATIIDVVE
mmetsp:Transcript_24500/g.38788  ORF Transcript_24500/g.38788 Transcript_24500/m.38788 type:complete len:106 (-) Transcript_24500:355-672(-)